METAVPAAGDELSLESFHRLADYITSRVGIKMPNTKQLMVYSRLLRRLHALGLHSVEQYSEYVLASGHEEEKEHFINAITTNKTDFFREPDHFDFLVRVVLPELAGNARADFSWYSCKLWSAGCSSGEEPYTLAMILSEYAAERPGFDYAILGTDVSTKVLKRAKTGIYRDGQIDPVPAHLRSKYVWRSRHKAEGLVRIAPALRQNVSFHPLNFMDEDYGIRDIFDVIFFRNVMIYFDRDTQAKVICKLCRHLKPGGYLFVGHSESLVTLDVPVIMVQPSIFRYVADQ